MDNERYKTFSYEITTDPDFMDEQSAMTPELHSMLEPLFEEVMKTKSGKKVINKLLKLVEKYPENPQLKNFLTVAYNNTGNQAKARETNRWIQAEHPDYLFGKINQAAHYYEDKEYEKIPEILGKLMEIQDLYPHRDVFHLSEVTSYYKIAVLYFIAIDDIEAAATRFEIMEEIAPEHPDTEFITIHMMRARMEKNFARLEEQDKSNIHTKPAINTLPKQTTEPPIFANPVVADLYKNGLYINNTLIDETLLLPRQSLIADLELILNDLFYRYDFFHEEVDNNSWMEEDMSFPIHAFFILGQLRAEQSLPKVLEVLKQDYDFLSFWFGDHKTESLWEPLYYLGNNRLNELQRFIQEPGIDTYAKSAVSDAVNQIFFHQPQRKKEVVSWYKDAFDFFINSKIEDNVIDSETIAFFISNVIELHETSLIPEIEKLFELGYVSISIVGNLKDVLKDINNPSKHSYKRELMDVYDRYNHITNNWAGYKEDYDDVSEPVYDDFEDIPATIPVKKDPKIGRNDPCPCGSGKKYKKCCLNKS